MRIQGIRSNGFLPLSIQFHQFLHAAARFQPLRLICNHFSIIIGEWEYEAIGRGVVKRPYTVKEHHYAKEWKIPTIYEEAVKRFLEDQVDKKYEFLNFFYHIIRIWFGKWIGGKNDTYSCIELVNRSLIIAGLDVNANDSPYETQRRLESLYSGVVTKQQPKDFISVFLYWITPAMKLAATILIIYFACKGLLFKGINVINYF